MSENDVSLVRELFRGWNERGELPGDQLIAPDFELHSPMSRERGEPYRGVAGAHAWAQELDERFPGFQFELEQLEQHGNQVLALGRLAVEGHGTAAGLSRPEGWVISLRDGRFTRLEVFTDVRAAREAVAVRA